MSKIRVIKDELIIKGGGIYCFLPFSNLDKNGNAVMKIGMATSLYKRADQYHTYFPMGLYMIAFLENPPIPMKLRSSDTKNKLLKKLGEEEIKFTKASHYTTVEKFVIKTILEQPGTKRIHSTTHVQNPNENLEGASEWIYCSEKMLKKHLKMRKNYMKVKIY